MLPCHSFHRLHCHPSSRKDPSAAWLQTVLQPPLHGRPVQTNRDGSISNAAQFITGMVCCSFRCCNKLQGSVTYLQQSYAIDRLMLSSSKLLLDILDAVAAATPHQKRLPVLQKWEMHGHGRTTTRSVANITSATRQYKVSWQWLSQQGIPARDVRVTTLNCATLRPVRASHQPDTKK